MEIELRELKYFVAVAQTGTLTKAADQLFISQPALTKVIQKLEASIGAPLFAREKNQLRITDLGQELLEKTRLLLRDYDAIWRSITDTKNVESGFVSIGLPPCTIPLLFHDIFLQYKASHPNISLYFTDNGREAVVRDLLSGVLDLGIMVLEFPNEDIEEVPLYYGSMVAVLPDNHPLAAYKVLEFSQLKGEPLCILQDNYLMAQQTLRKCKEAGFEPIISCSNSNCDFLAKMAQAQNHIAIIPRPIYLENQYDHMIDIPFQEPWPWTICIAWRKGAYLSHATKELRNAILDRFPNQLHVD